MKIVYIAQNLKHCSTFTTQANPEAANSSAGHPVLPTATTDEQEIKEPSESEGVSSDAESFYGFDLDSDDGNESSQSMVESEEN
jgi:hypothetical protein